MREPEPFLQVQQQVEDLGAHRDVERAGRLVGDQQRGLQRQRAGDRDPLPLAAGELAGQQVGDARRQPDQVEQLADPLLALRGGAARGARRAGRAGPGGPAAGGSAPWTGPGRSSPTLDPIDRTAAARPSSPHVRGPRRTPCRRSAAAARRATLASVDLPQPDSPTTPTVSPGATRQVGAGQRVDRGRGGTGRRSGPGARRARRRVRAGRSRSPPARPPRSTGPTGSDRRVVAGDRVLGGARRSSVGRLGAADVGGHRAAVGEPAAGREVGRRRHHAADLGEPRRAGLQRQHRAQQAAGVVVRRRADQRRR